MVDLLLELVNYHGPTQTEIACLENIWRLKGRKAILKSLSIVFEDTFPQDVVSHICSFLYPPLALSATLCSKDMFSSTYILEVGKPC